MPASFTKSICLTIKPKHYIVCLHMAHNKHAHLVHELEELISPLFTKSKQPIYLYLDDEHKTCNKAYAALLGYKNVQEWVENLYPVDDFDPKDQPKGIKAFMNATEKLQASTTSGTMVKQNGKKIKAEITMVPLPYKKEVFLLTFISPK